MKASGRRSIGLAFPSTTRKGWARPGVNFVLGLLLWALWVLGARQTHTPKSYVSPYESYEYNATPPHAGRQRPRWRLVCDHIWSNWGQRLQARCPQHDKYQHWPMQLLPLRQRESSMVRLHLVGEVGSESLQALRIGMQSDKKRYRSFFCKCVSRLDARQVPWHRQGPEEVILES